MIVLTPKMEDFQKKELTDIVNTSGLGNSKVEITEWASITMTLRRTGDYWGFLDNGSSILLFRGDFANLDEYNLLLKSTHTGEPATIQGILQTVPGNSNLYCLRVSGVKYKNESSKRYKR